jgi:DNA replication protein DnaC
MSDNITEIDLEKFVLSSLVHNAFLFSSLKNTIKVAYFSDILLRKVFDILLKGFEKYSKVLNYQELCLELVHYIKDENERLQLKNVLGEIFYIEFPNEFGKLYNKSYINNKIEDFVKTKLVQSVVSEDIALKLKNSEEIDYPAVYKKLSSLNSISLISQSVPFKLSEVDKVWDQNPVNTLKIISSNFHTLNKSLQYKGYCPRTINIVTGPPGGGKSTILISEGANAILQQKNVIHIVLGDLTSWDVFLRYVPSLLNSEKYTSEILSTMSKADISKVIADNNVDGRFDRLVIETFPAYSVTADALYDECVKLSNDYYQNKIDLIVVDYADNIILEHDMMYEGRGIQYQKLEKLAWDLDAVVYTASQPKGSYWDAEYVTDSNINAESSKKKHIIDLDLAMGKPIPIPSLKGCAIGTLVISKSRRGESGKPIHVMYDYLRNNVTEITYDRYLELRKLSPTLATTTGNNNRGYKKNQGQGQGADNGQG